MTGQFLVTTYMLTMAVVTVVVMNAILFGSLSLLPFYIQEGLGADPLRSRLIVQV